MADNYYFAYAELGARACPTTVSGGWLDEWDSRDPEHHYSDRSQNYFHHLGSLPPAVGSGSWVGIVEVVWRSEFEGEGVVEELEGINSRCKTSSHLCELMI